MSVVLKTAGGAVLGVGVPLVSEYALKGGRVLGDPAVAKSGIKISGIIGLIQGILGIGLAYYSHKTGKITTDPENRALLGAMGGAGLATGTSIIILDELRKRGTYEFRRRSSGTPRKLPLKEGLQYPTPIEFPEQELVEEI